MPPNWKCSVCGLVLRAEGGPPLHCPECNALGAMFTRTDEPPHGIPHNPFQPHDHESGGDVLGPGEAGCMDPD